MIDIPGPTFSNAICVWCPLCKTLQKLFHQISTMEIRSRFTNANFVYGNLTSQREFMMPYLNSRSKFQYTMWKKNGTLLLSYVHSLPNQYFVKYNLHGSFLIFCKIVLFLLDFKVNMLLQLLLPKSEASQKTSFHAAVANLKLAIHSVEIAEIHSHNFFFVKFPWNQHIKY